MITDLQKALIDLLLKQGYDKDLTAIVAICCLDNDEALKQMIDFVYNQHRSQDQLIGKAKELQEKYNPQMTVED